MGSVGFDGEDESQPSTSNGKKYKLPRTLLEGCGAVDHASVPRKLRSAIKKRGRESVTPPPPISKKQYNVSNGVEKLRKNGAKKSKMNMKHGHITKDEEEVAETLYALACMFSDAKKDDMPEVQDEPPEMKSPAIPEAGSSGAVADTGIQALQEESQKISSKVTLEAASHSPDVMDSTAQVLKFQFSGDAQQPELASNKQPATASTSGVQSDLSLDRRLQLLKMASIIIPWMTKIMCTQAAAGSERTWKRCSAHVHISRLIKVLQVSERKEGLLEKPTRLTTCGGAELQPPVSTHNQMTGMNSGVPFNGATCSTAEKDSAEIQNDILLHKRPLQNQPLASETSSAKQVQLPHYLSSTVNSSFAGRTGQQLESQQQKWATQCNSGKVGSPHLPDWKNVGRDSSSMLNYAHALFPHLHAALGSKYQQLSPQQQQQLMAINSSSLPLSSVKRQHNLHIPLGFERNGTAIYPEIYRNCNCPATRTSEIDKLRLIVLQKEPSLVHFFFPAIMYEYTHHLSLTRPYNVASNGMQLVASCCLLLAYFALSF
ncbi:UNVERIFIED_CONTAM: hypothetical protein Slati_2325800 [Sesamum latifolium]|uniref:Uncharacterized protein n=1 Tax=Sesamum latifolium TaxID=2727402 RepID=A0AAW2WA46_9LAMI